LDHLENNPTKRSNAKGELNVLLGKFDLRRTEYISDPKQFHELMNDQIKVVNHMKVIPSDSDKNELVLVNYVENEYFGEDCVLGNVVLATTRRPWQNSNCTNRSRN